MIELLNKNHAELAKTLFYSTDRYMGVDLNVSSFMEKDAEFLSIAYTNFCDTYLSDLNNFKAYGNIEDGKMNAYIAFYESNDAPEWFGTQIRSHDKKIIPSVLDKVMEHNEARGRFKFYSMFNMKYAKSFRRFAFSEYNSERYGSYEEFIVPAKTKCVYTMPWQILYNRTLVPVDTIVRCTFLKNEYRIIPIAGSL